MDELEKFMSSIAAELTSLQQQIETSQHTFQVLQSSLYVTEEEESEAFWAMRRWPNKLAEVSLHTGQIEQPAEGVELPLIFTSDKTHPDLLCALVACHVHLQLLAGRAGCKVLAGTA